MYCFTSPISHSYFRRRFQKKLSQGIYHRVMLSSHVLEIPWAVLLLELKENGKRFVFGKLIFHDRMTSDF